MPGGLGTTLKPFLKVSTRRCPNRSGGSLWRCRARAQRRTHLHTLGRCNVINIGGVPQQRVFFEATPVANLQVPPLRCPGRDYHAEEQPRADQLDSSGNLRLDYKGEAQSSSGGHNQTREVLKIMALGQSIDDAQRAKSSWLEDCWEDRREHFSHEQAYEDRRSVREQHRRRSPIGLSYGGKTKTNMKTWHDEDTRANEQRHAEEKRANPDSVYNSLS